MAGWKKITGITAAVLGLTVGVLLLFLYTIVLNGPLQPPVLRFAEKKLAPVLGQQVHIGRLRLGLLRGTLTVGDVSLAKELPAGEIPFAAVDRITVRFGITELLGSRPHIRSVRIETPRVLIYRGADSLFNLPGTGGTDTVATTEAADLPSLPVALDSLIIVGASFEQNDTALAGFRLRVPEIDLNLTGIDGEYYQVTLRTAASVLDLPGMRIPVDGLSLNGRAAIGDWHVDSLGFTAAGQAVTARGRMQYGRGRLPLETAVRISGRPQDASGILKGLLPPELDVTGVHDLEAKVSGPLDSLKIAVGYRLPRIRYDTFVVPSGMVRARLAGDNVFVDDAQLHVLGGGLRLRGSLRFDSLLTTSVAADLSGISLSRLWQAAGSGPSPYSGTVLGRLEFNGALADPFHAATAVRLKIDDPLYEGHRLPDFSLTAAGRQGRVTVDLENDLIRLHTSGTFGEKAMNAMLELSSDDISFLGGFMGKDDLRGSVRFTGMARGFYTDPVASGDLTVTDAVFRSFPLDKVDAAVRYERGELTVGKADFSGDLPAIDSLQGPFGITGLTGRARYNGSVSGTVLKAFDLNGDISLSLQDAGYNGTRIEQMETDIHFSSDTVYVLRLNARAESLDANLEGAVTVPDIAGFIRGTVQAADGSGLPVNLDAGFDLRGLPRINGTVRLDAPDIAGVSAVFLPGTDIGGALFLEARVSGTSDNPDVRLAGSLRSPRYNGFGPDSVLLNVSYRDETVCAESVAVFREADRLTAWGTVIPPPDSLHGPEITAGTRGSLDLGQLAPLLPEGMTVTGRAAADLSVQRSGGRNGAAGTISIMDGFFKSGDNPPVDHIRLTCTVRDSSVTIDDAVLNLPQTAVQVRGIVALTGLERIGADLTVDARDWGTLKIRGTAAPDALDMQGTIRAFDLSLVQPFVPAVGGLKGMADVQLAVRGTPALPRLEGTAVLDGLGVLVPDAGLAAADGHLAMRFTRDEAFLDTLRVKINDGALAGSGTVRYSRDAVEAVDAALALADIRIERPGIFLFDLDRAELNCTGSSTGYTLAADITTGEVRYTDDLKPRAFLAAARSVEGPERELPAVLENTRLNVTLRDKRGWWLDNNLGKVRIEPAVSVHGTVPHPVISGRVSVKNGYVVFLDRKFKITRGIADFADPQRVNPVLDLQAESRVTPYRSTDGKPYRVYLAVTGPLDEAVMDLRTDPSLERSDIVSLLTVGTVRGQTAAGGADGWQGAVWDRVGTFGSGKVTGYVSRNVERTLGLEQFTIEGNLFNFDSSWGPQLVASKKLTDRVELTYRTTVGHFNEQNIRLNYKLTESLSVEGETDQKGNAGIDLKYGLEFR